MPYLPLLRRLRLCILFGLGVATAVGAGGVGSLFLLALLLPDRGGMGAMALVEFGGGAAVLVLAAASGLVGARKLYGAWARQPGPPLTRRNRLAVALLIGVGAASLVVLGVAALASLARTIALDWFNIQVDFPNEVIPSELAVGLVGGLALASVLAVAARTHRSLAQDA